MSGGDFDRDDGVVYDLADWTPELRATLDRLLSAEGVACTWDDPAAPSSWMTPGAVTGPPSPAYLSTELVVADRHADLVEELIDELDYPDALAVEDDDGDDGGAELLSSLYVAADVLCGASGQAQAGDELLAATTAMDGMAAPYGLDPGTWDELGRRARHLAGLLAAGDEEGVVEAARDLRQVVRPLV